MNRTSPSRIKVATGRQRRALWAGCIAAGLLCSGLPAAQAEVVDRIVLRVNDRIATLADYETRRNDALAQLEQEQGPPEEKAKIRAELGSRIFRDMFEELLLLSRADQLRANPTDEEVDAEIAKVRERFGIPNDDAFAAALAAQGMSLTGFREQLRGQLRVREVMGREIQGSIKVEEDDLRRIYRTNQDAYRYPERRQVRDLVVLDRADVPAEEEARLAGELGRALAAGKTLEELAAIHQPKGETSAVVDLGWVAPGELSPELEAAAWALTAGAFSAPIPSRGGLHLVQVQAIEPAGIRAFSDVAQEIENRERDRQFAEKMQQFMRKLEEQAYVKAEPPADAAGFRTVAGTKTREDRFERLDPAREATKAVKPGDGR